MSNLGLYQKMTTWAKKMGGPLQFLGAVAVGGYIVLRTAETGGKAVAKVVKKRFVVKEENTSQLYDVLTSDPSKIGIRTEAINKHINFLKDIHETGCKILML